MIVETVNQSVKRKSDAMWFMPMMAALFFVSGLCGLIYQVLWLRQLALVFGVTIYAASTVLAGFMAGLALGSVLAGRYVDRSRNPLLWYGIAEVLVGLSALATPAAFGAVEHLYAASYPSLSDAPGLLTLVRFLLSFLVLIVPTTLMGATLPIIVKSSLLRSDGLGTRVSLLYATNTAGAIVGTLVAGFYLIGRFGMNQSFQLAAALNLLVGALAVIVSPAIRRSRAQADKPQEHEEDMLRQSDPVTEMIATVRTRKLVLFVFAVSGLISLALEVAWFRILVLFIEVSTYAFTVMLAVFLCGIAAGSYLITPIMKRRMDWLKILAIVELGIAITSVLSLMVLGYAYDIAGSGDKGVGLVPMFAASFVVIFPTTLLMGIAFPIGLRLWAADGVDDSSRTGERVGLFYSLNVFGAIIGSIVAGFALLPGLGSRASVIVLGAVSLVLGLWLLFSLPKAHRRFSMGGAAPALATFVIVAITVPDPLDVMLARRFPGQQMLYREEGVQTTASVVEESGKRVLYLNGQHQANDSADMVLNHNRLGHLPMILHPNPKDALVVGLGGGVTAGAVSEHPGVHVDVVELSRTAVHAAEWFSHVNHDVLRKPNVQLRVDDGRNYMMLTSKRYDVITADLIQPTRAGAGNLYSVEYFRIARNALRDDGLMLQWNTLNSEAQYKLILQTFMSVFPNTTIWAKGKLLIGSKRPLELDPAVFEQKLRDPAFRMAAEHIGLGSFQSVLALYEASAEDVREYVAATPILTDDLPRSEYFLSLQGADRRVKRKRWRGDVTRHLKQ